MPLVVPGMMGKNSIATNGKEEWMSKLMGKKISDGSTDNMSFAKKDLPKEHRILEPGAITTTDVKENRLNVHLAEDGTVRDVKFG